MATHSSILAWRIPIDRGTWWTVVHRVAKSRTPLKRLSTHIEEKQNKITQRQLLDRSLMVTL